MALHHELSFWFGVGLVAVVSVLLVKIIFLRLPFQPLQRLAAAL